MYYITNVFDSNTFILQNHKLCSIINMKKEEKTDVEAVSLFSKNGSLSNVGVKDRQIFVYPFSLF